MTWERLELAGAPTLADLPEVRAMAVTLRSAGGLRQILLRLKSSAGWSIDLEEAVDTSAGTGQEAIHVVVSAPRDRIFTIGGRLAYRVSAAGAVEARVELNRDPLDEEYWSTELHETPEGLLIAYEGGIFLLDVELSVVWHRQKIYNDRIQSVSGDEVQMLGDRGERWTVSLRSGRAPSK